MIEDVRGLVAPSCRGRQSLWSLLTTGQQVRRRSLAVLPRVSAQPFHPLSFFSFHFYRNCDFISSILRTHSHSRSTNPETALCSRSCDSPACVCFQTDEGTRIWIQAGCPVPLSAPLVKQDATKLSTRTRTGSQKGDRDRLSRNMLPYECFARSMSREE